MPEPNVTGSPWTLNPALPGVVDCREIYRGRSRQANLDGVPTYVRIFLVRTDTINPNLTYVAAAPGINWRDSHPNDVNAVLVESSTQQDGDSPFHYKVTYTYKYLDESERLPWNRPSQFSFNGSLASAPAFWCFSPNDTNNSQTQIIVNSAGDPLQGLDRDEGEFAVTIQKNVRPPFSYANAQLYVGSINSDTWGGGAAKTWKVQSITATRKYEVIPGLTPNDAPVKTWFWDTSSTLAYRASGWDLRTWDVGFNEIVSGQRKKIYAGSEPVSEPVALTAGRAKTPGQPPDMLTFRIYPMRTFTGYFPALPDTAYTGHPYNL
jgi:hypothetical protein